MECSEAESSCCCVQSEHTNAEYAKHIKELEERLRDFEQRYANAQATIKVRASKSTRLHFLCNCCGGSHLLYNVLVLYSVCICTGTSLRCSCGQAKILRRQADRPTWYLPSRENGAGGRIGGGGGGGEGGGGGRRLDEEREAVSRSRSQYALAASPHTTAPTTGAFANSGPLLIVSPTPAASGERTRALRFRTPAVEPAPSPLDDDTAHDVLHRY